MRVELEKHAARALALRITAWTYCEIAPKLGRTTMAKKLSQVKKSSAKAKAKGDTKVMASGCAKPARKRGTKAAQSAKRATGKPAKRGVKTPRPARTQVVKQRARTASSRSQADLACDKRVRSEYAGSCCVGITQLAGVHRVRPFAANHRALGSSLVNSAIPCRA